MRSDKVEADRRYMRGLMLGFTLSEVSLLLLFCLLLVLGSRLMQLTKERDEAKDEVRQRQEAIGRLTERIESQAALVEEVRRRVGADSRDSFDDVFKDLVLAQEVRAERDALEKEVAGLRERDAELVRVEAAIEKLGGDSAVAPSAELLVLHSEMQRLEREAASKSEKCLADLEAKQRAVSAIVAAAGLAEEKESTDGRAVDQAVAALKERAVLLAMREQAMGASSPGELLEDVREGLELVAEKREKAIGGKGLGKGASYPPCWRNPETSKPDYLFAIRLREGGLMVYDVIPPHRAGDRASLKMDQLRLGELLSADAFREATSGLFRDSEQASCRHFVRVFDETESKATYKSQLQVVEGHFYKLLSTELFGASSE